MKNEEEEACAILGLKKSELTLQEARRNYREKVKHCHPDRATYPGAAADFKRATEALRVVERYLSRKATSAGGADRINLTRVAQRFELHLVITDREAFSLMTPFEKLRAYFRGWGIHNFNEGEVAPQGVPLAFWSFARQPQNYRDVHPLLLAPLDCHVRSVELKDHSIEFRVRPLDVVTIAAYLDEVAEQCGGLEQAEACLVAELRAAARTPLSMQGK